MDEMAEEQQQADANPVVGRLPRQVPTSSLPECWRTSKACYCEYAMYAQNTMNANRNLPTSW